MVRVRSIAMAAVLAAVLVVAASCSSDDGGSTSPGHAKSGAGLKAAATDFSTKLVSSNPKGAYAYLTDACHSKVSEAAFVQGTKQSLALVKQYAANGESVKVGEVRVRNVSGDKGEVALLLLGSDGKPLTDGSAAESDPPYEPWVYEDGDWRPVSCGGTEAGPGDPTVPTSS